MKTLQIGVMGSAADLEYSQEMEKVAEKIGELIAKNGHILVYGAEKDYDSLSTAAARGAKKYEGMTIGVTYGRSRDIFNPETTDVIIRTGLFQRMLYLHDAFSGRGSVSEKFFQ